jgi:hypothetical protein
MNYRKDRFQLVQSRASPRNYFEGTKFLDKYLMKLKKIEWLNVEGNMV